MKVYSLGQIVPQPPSTRTWIPHTRLKEPISKNIEGDAAMAGELWPYDPQKLEKSKYPPTTYPCPEITKSLNITLETYSSFLAREFIQK